jgi:hypothetical protein
MPRSADFFQRIVEPTVREYLDKRGDLRLGFLAAIVLNQMADYWAHDGHAPTPANLRERLRIECTAFALINDVADASKHVELGRKSRRLTTVDQISSSQGLFDAPFGTGVFHEAWVASATLDDGTTHALDEAVLAVLAMWQTKLNTSRSD